MYEKIYYHVSNSVSSKTFKIGRMSRVFACGPGDRGPIPGRVIPKTQKNGT